MCYIFNSLIFRSRIVYRIPNHRAHAPRCLAAKRGGRDPERRRRRHRTVPVRGAAAVGVAPGHGPALLLHPPRQVHLRLGAPRQPRRGPRPAASTATVIKRNRSGREHAKTMGGVLTRNLSHDSDRRGSPVAAGAGAEAGGRWGGGRRSRPSATRHSWRRKRPARTLHPACDSA